MNNKPVAWMWYQSKENTNPYTQMTGYSQLCFSEFEPDCNVVMVDEGTLIPLYTHPVKELTDEEIMEAWQEAKHTALNTKGNFVEVLFARAILRKAQEKC